ncbi:hypothetical protein [Otariodibacter sp.]|uniref:hypothetical protein n=1 Tax=Otariodibacter sp. TaxID=3030919 RepID=UPI0026321E79|nr:hypothetical protein [Otariodibacter sp.]
MKHWRLKHFFGLIIVLVLSACSFNKPTGWTRLADNEVDQKSYAIGYGATAQTYLDRVNESFDINSFIRGVDDWYSQRVTLPVEQIRASLLNRMLDHDVYTYYSGVLYAAELQGNANRLSPKCWSFVEPKSTTQGINDAMVDLQRNQVRDDDYIKQGAEQILHLCVAQVEKDQRVSDK